MALHSIIENIVLDDSDGLIKIRDGATLRQFADVSAITAAVLAALPYKTAVVDIGPHSNTGLGDQTKGILDWSASPIVIVAAPGLTKYINVLGGSFQYKSGAVAFIDGFSQIIGLFWNGSYILTSGSVSRYNLDTTTSLIIPSMQFFTVQLQGQYTSGGMVANLPLLFGDSNGSGELTVGDGTVRITVYYTIDGTLN